MTSVSRLRSSAYIYLLLSLASLQWGANVVLGRLAVGQIAPMQLVCLRWAIVFVVLAAFGGRRLAADWPKLKGHLGLLIALGISGYTGFTAFFYVAAHYTSGANMAIIQGATPLFVFSFAYLVDRQRIGAWQAAGMLLALIGVVFVAAKGSWAMLTHLRINPGDLCMMGATICYSFYTVALARKPAASALSVFTVLAAVALVTSVPLALFEAMTTHVQWPTPAGWGLTVLVAIFPSFLAQIFYMRGVEAIGPGRSGIFVNLIPVFGAGLSVLFLGEHFGWYQAAGLTFVMLGIVAAQRR